MTATALAAERTTVPFLDRDLSWLECSDSRSALKSLWRKEKICTVFAIKYSDRADTW